TTVATYLLGAHVAGPVAGVGAAAIYAALSLNPKVLGIAAYAEHFALLPVVIATLLLWRAARDRRPALVVTCGLLFGLGLLIRQSAALFVAAGVFYLLVSEIDATAAPRAGRGKAVAVFVAGAAAPLALTCLWLLATRAFKTFWVWVVSYAPHHHAHPATGGGKAPRALRSLAPPHPAA